MMKWIASAVYAVAFLCVYAGCYELCGEDLGLARNGCDCTMRLYKFEIVAKMFIPAAWVEAKITRAPVELWASDLYSFPHYEVEP